MKRLPSEKEFQELIDKCEWEGTNVNGVNGYKVIGHNGNSIFLPKAGFRCGSVYYCGGNTGYYWSSTLSSSKSNYAQYFYFNGSYFGMFANNRKIGQSVRLVSDTEGVDLGLSINWCECNYGATKPEEYGKYLNYKKAIKLNFNNMKQNIEIEVPEGFVAKYNAQTNKIEFIKINSKPKSWEEYCKQTKGEGFFYINECFSTIEQAHKNKELDPKKDKNLICSKKDGEAFVALMQLRQLRKAWIGDWLPNYECNTGKKWHILFISNILEITWNTNAQRTLSFPTREMAEEFSECFHDLILRAEPLL